MVCIDIYISYQGVMEFDMLNYPSLEHNSLHTC
jgi:hypothetical protein